MMSDLEFVLSLVGMAAVWVLIDYSSRAQHGAEGAAMMRRPEVIGYHRDGSPLLWFENLEDGDSIVCDSRLLRRTSAWLARQRLRNIVVADRAAVPCGRWVRRHYGIYHAAIVAGYASAAWDAYRRGDLGLARLYRELLRPRYRYEVRR